MLISSVVLPEAFVASHFDDPAYHLNMEVCLRGVNSNGLILVDAEERLYQQMCDQIEPLANHGKGKTTHALFEELLKMRRQKIIRFVKTDCSFHSTRQLSDVATCVARTCNVDSLLTDSTNQSELEIAIGGAAQVISISDYIGSKIESKRRRFVESLPSLDKMEAGEFDRLIISATRFSRWLRFYDKQVGKGTNLSRFRRGINRILQVWTNNAYFPRDQLSVELFTVVDESPYKQLDPPVAYHRVKGDLVDPLQQDFGIPIKLFVKHDAESKCHPRHLQSQSLAIMFERGFDILEDDTGRLCRSFMTAGGDFSGHLQEVRTLPEYLP